MSELSEPVFLGTAEELKLDLPDKDINELIKGNWVCPVCKGTRVDPIPGCEPPGPCERCKGTGKVE